MKNRLWKRPHVNGQNAYVQWLADEDVYLAFTRPAGDAPDANSPVPDAPFELKLADAQRNADRATHMICLGQCAGWIEAED